MPLSVSDAIATITAPGARFELATVPVDGQDQTVFASSPRSLREVLDTLRTRDPDAVALVYEDERLTFADTVAAIDAVAASLVHHHGIQPGDRVAISLRNYPEWILTFAATVSVGAIAVCLNAWWTTDELRYGLDDCGATLLVADEERVDRVVPLLDEPAFDALRVLAVRFPAGTPPHPRIERWEEALVPGAPMPDVDVTPDLDATILYTSGTTGFPKGAVSTHGAVVAALMAFACRGVATAIVKQSQRDADGLAPQEKSDPTSFILVVPLFHVTGLIPVMLGALSGGSKLVMMHKWNPERALELIERERITTFVGVPTMSFDLLDSPDFATRDTSSLVSVGGGGAPAPPELVKRIDASFSKGRPSIGYGMTETNAYGPQNMGDDYIRKPTSAGRTVPTMQVRVVDPDTGRALGTDEVGEIEFRGPNLIRGYWNDVGATNEAFHDGWLRSGDLGRIDDEGFVYVVDRAKDMVLRGGENIYCAEVEAAIYEHDAIHEAAVFGLPHERLGEEPAAAIVLRHGTSLDAEALQDFLRGRLASFKVPAAVFIHDEPLPRGATGKILKRSLRDLHHPS